MTTHKDRKYPGYFISLEGSEGAGKTIVLRDLEQWLKGEFGLNKEICIIREPGGTPIGEQIRNVLFGFENSEITRRTQSALFMASRAQIVEEVIIPKLETGSIVIADRFRDSSVAYQGYAQGLGCGRVDYFNDFVTQGLEPDLTIYLDVRVEEGLERKKRSGKEINILDKQAYSFYQDIAYAYKTMAQMDTSGRWETIDASRPYAEVFEDVKKIVTERLHLVAGLEGNRKTSQERG